MFLSEIEGLFRSGAMPIDVCLLQATPPDGCGYLNLGSSVDYSLAAVECARRVIRGDQRPGAAHAWRNRTSRKPGRRVYRDIAPVGGVPPPEVSPVHRAIASRVASLIPDGATIQTGIGSLPQAVLEFLRDHKDLGIHSELIGDGVIDLIEAGIMNNSRKTLHRHKAVSGFALGPRRLFDFMDHNPVFEFRPTSYTNDS